MIEKQKVVTVVKSISCPGRIRSDQWAEQGLKALAIVKKLEQNGCRVNVDIIDGGADYSNVGFSCRVRVKNASERLSISKLAFTCRMVIDQATLDRFAIIELGYDTGIEMLMAENDDDLVDFIRSLRKSAEGNGIRATFSYRHITMAKKLENAGMPLGEAIKIAAAKGLGKDTINTLRVKAVHCGNRFVEAFNKVKAA